MPQNLVEKIAQKAAVGWSPDEQVKSGDYISIRPRHVMTHDNTGAVIPKFFSIGAKKIANPRQIVCTLDHNVQDKSPKNLAKYTKIEEFCQEMGVDFYPAGRGIGHQVMCEEGYAWPGEMIVASDSHSNMYGGLGCLGTPVVRTDAAAIWATGRTWWQVPPVARVELKGKLLPGVTGKDVIIALCGLFASDEVLNHTVEFVGDGVSSLSIDQRLTIANMTTEWGALAGVFPIDEATFAWLKKRAEFIEKRGLAKVPSDQDSKEGEHPRLNQKRIDSLSRDFLAADSDATYAKDLIIDLSTIQPYVCGPNTVKVMHPVSTLEKEKIQIHKAYLVSCVNSRVEDLNAAAQVIAGKKVAPGVEFYISAASSEVQSESEKKGDWQKLLDAGATPLPSGCGPCIGLGQGLLQDGEVGISATNRNFKGRMGSSQAEAYLASPPVVTASAIAGFIASPYSFENRETKTEIKNYSSKSQARKATKIIEGFSPKIMGKLVFCSQDNLNTDGIYPGKYTYKDEITPQEQAAVVMENYDPEFSHLVQEGDILVGGFNFGTGSSREQAATALMYKGLKLVIAGSFSETYKRNALNNGFLAIEAPLLVQELKEIYKKNNALTIITQLEAEICFSNSTISVQAKEYPFSPLGVAAQELIVEKGLGNWVKKQIG